MQSAVFRPQYYTEINKTAIISSPPVIIRTFGVNNWMWFKITKSAEKLDNNRENKNSKCKSKCCRPVKTLIKKNIEVNSHFSSWKCRLVHNESICRGQIKFG